MDKINATNIYKNLESLTTSESARVYYTREVDIRGEPSDHKFIIHGGFTDSRSFYVFSDFLTEFSPNYVELSSSTKPHISVVFDDDRIINAPPESEKEYKSIHPSDANKETIHECENCLRKTEPSVPPIKLFHRPESEFDDAEIEEMKFCVSCSPARYDKVVQHWNGFGITDGKVTHLKRQSYNEYDDDYNVVERHDEKWITIEKFKEENRNDGPTIDLINVIERNLNS